LVLGDRLSRSGLFWEGGAYVETEGWEGEVYVETEGWGGGAYVEAEGREGVGDGIWLIGTLARLLCAVPGVRPLLTTSVPDL